MPTLSPPIVPLRSDRADDPRFLPLLLAYVDDLARTEAKLAEHGVPVLARTKIGPMSFVAVRDPDGRVVCFGTRWPAPRSGS